MLVERVLRQYFDTLNIDVSFKSREKVKTDRYGDAEVDILIIENRGRKRNIVVECKAYSSVVRWKNPKDSSESVDKTNNYARHFFNETTDKLQEKFGKGNFCMCMIAANGFNDETKIKIRLLSQYKHEKLEILYSAKELINVIKQSHRDQNIPFKVDDADLIEKFFIVR